jgi:predicted DNA-binding protein (MmcQ/YjbR family)
MGKGQPSVNLKCDPERVELRAEYDVIQPGFHMSKTHWNTIALNESVSMCLSKN